MSWQPLTASKHSQVVHAPCNSHVSSGGSDFKHTPPPPPPRYRWLTNILNGSLQLYHVWLWSYKHLSFPYPKVLVAS